MIRVFSFSLVANVFYVITGAVKQYFIAAQLTVADVGIYGTWLAQAMLLAVLIPFPAYLELLIKGFSAAPDDHALRGGLIGGVLRELRLLSIGAGLLIAASLVYALLSGNHDATLAALLVLLVAQYLGFVADISLRLYRLHERYAVFVALRNLPTLLLIAALGLDQPMAIALSELASALVVGAFAFRAAPLWRRDRSLAVVPRLLVAGEQKVLWLARLVQIANTSLLRLVVPLAFGAHDTGLFFFACIAQTPASMFLSTSNQLFGHDLACMKRGEFRSLMRIQMWFLLPNLAYVLFVALLVPYWPWLMNVLPGLSQYAGVGMLVLALALYSSILASDCTEFLLRSRGLSRLLLKYNLCSIAVQITCLGICAVARISIEYSIILCATCAAAVLLSFSSYSFRRVIGRESVHGA